MNIEQFLLMRHELLLVITALILIVAEIFVADKTKIIPLGVGLFFVNLVIGFLPAQTGTLFGGMFHNTDMTIMMKNVLNIGTFIVILQSAAWLKKPENHDKLAEFIALLISTLVGMQFMISSGDFLMFYIGLETATIPVAALAAFERIRNRSAEAGVKLILSSALSSGVLLYGLSMIYGTTGSIYFDAVALAFTGTQLQTLAFIYFLAGMAFKISLVPFHLWAADVYEGAPINVTSYLSVVSKGAAVFILTILLFTVFSKIVAMWQNVLYTLAVLTMTVGNLFALRQKNIKRFLAFSSIAQAGFILLGMLGANELGSATVVYFVLIYIFSNLSAFGVATLISNNSGKENIDEYNGFYSTNPGLSLIMLLALFSLAGIPPVAGFFAKFFLFTAAASAGYYWLVFIAVINATISLFYYLLVVKAMFINKNDNPIAPITIDIYSKVGLILAAVGLVVTGLWSDVFEVIRGLSFGIN